MSLGSLQQQLDRLDLDLHRVQNSLRQEIKEGDPCHGCIAEVINTIGSLRVQLSDVVSGQSSQGGEQRQQGWQQEQRQQPARPGQQEMPPRRDEGGQPEARTQLTGHPLIGSEGTPLKEDPRGTKVMFGGGGLRGQTGGEGGQGQEEPGRTKSGKLDLRTVKGFDRRAGEKPSEAMPQEVG